MVGAVGIKPDNELVFRECARLVSFSVRNEKKPVNMPGSVLPAHELRRQLMVSGRINKFSVIGPFYFMNIKSSEQAMNQSIY